MTGGQGSTKLNNRFTFGGGVGEYLRVSKLTPDPIHLSSLNLVMADWSLDTFFTKGK